MSKKLISAVAVATLGATALTAPVVNAGEKEASFSVANMYLFRGEDAGNGGAQVSGDLNYSDSGFTGGVWTSSAAGSSEIDLYASYGFEFPWVEGLDLEVGVVKYFYPEDEGSTWQENGNNDETYISAGYKDFGFSYWINNNDGDESYTTLSYGQDKWTATVGWVDAGDPTEDTATLGGGEGVLSAVGVDDIFTHLDVTYAVNDNFSFTASQIINRDEDIDETSANAKDNDLHLVVTYSMPIEL